MKRRVLHPEIGQKEMLSNVAISMKNPTLNEACSLVSLTIEFIRFPNMSSAITNHLIRSNEETFYSACRFSLNSGAKFKNIFSKCENKIPPKRRHHRQQHVVGGGKLQV